MFRASKLSLAPLAALKPVLAASVASEDVARRFVGFRSNRRADISALHSVVEKTKGEGLAGNAAVISRAALYLNSHKPETALVELDAVLPKIKDEEVLNMATGLRLFALNQLLDAKEAMLSVSGGATEAEVSDLRSKVRDAYKVLEHHNPTCWMIELASAEYSLYTGDAEGSYVRLGDVEHKIRSFISAERPISPDIATPANTKPHSLLGFQMQRLHDTMAANPTCHSKLVQEAIQKVAVDPSAAENFAAFKKTLGVELTDKEATEVAFALQAASIRHHFHDFFPEAESSEYDLWASPAAQQALANVRAAYTPDTVGISDDMLNTIRTDTLSSVFYGDEAALRALLKNPPKDRSILAAIREQFGRGPSTALSAGDEVVLEAEAAIHATRVSADTAGTPLYAKRLTQLNKALAQQLLYRTQVQKAVSLIEMNRMQDAVDVVTPVIVADEYVYMWKAFLARSRAFKGLGLITNSDKDLKSLEALRKSLSGRAPHPLV
ncbi:hypothetical protein STCU_03124 [Strigomonas culicis]|uniref:Succinate dehydrogenase flavoprotein subunit n=1 Tax=Strigomonas culicis TaxID=28005 RepID=S9W7C5_9TRYP|nr:hypothetical protein STCU_03124 [Strigomonas culicis]|eukprot:EPY31900.1 hypothetical protein STCU_03124 [Strigomonas culicis]